ncbi:Endonuclease 8-like 3 [Liparis tanakae]|uniref:Endonuclease 8-like 3 n=1 Tax=Liparis tanakae TaxID=230148 RepID=A0A4Z2HYB8_9TELE|nr:Endonuclease 8-like 3 [Liparis tanakae]
MVEGPGCTLNGEKIRSKVQKGQKLKETRGSLITCTKNDPAGNAFHALVGCPYTGVETLGKELFVYFGLRALRVHFGMNGSMRINPGERKDTTGCPPALQIHLTNDTVCFFDSAVEMRLTEDCEQRVRALESLDVCSSRFSSSRSAEAVRSQGGRMLCDVLLDQAVMPGVGNIIKNEALFDSGLHPAVKCRKSGSPLHKHYKVYKRPRCGRCLGGVTVCRLGANGRMTYFCGSCQPADPSGVHVSELPVRSGLLGWARGERPDGHVTKREEEDWAFHKDDSNTEASPAAATGLIKYPCIAFRKPREELKVNWRSALGTSTLVFSDVSEQPEPARPPPPSPAGSHLNSSAAERGLYKSGVGRGTASPNYASGGSRRKNAELLSNGESPASSSHPPKKMRIDHGPFPGNNAQNGAPNSGVRKTESTSSAPPLCASHRRPAALRTVHKDGENKGRQFYACSLPRETKCNFFEWADLHFPSCHHGKRSLMRAVLKLGPNNGRHFYVCCFQKGKQCDFFQWAETGSGGSPPPGC